jgi:hypothetical protein
MVSASLDMLEESLVRKLGIMKQIQEENARQKELLSDPGHLEVAEFDKTLDVKGELIDKLLELDEGFQALFDRVKQEVGDHKEHYAEQIRRMQNLIHDISDASASIEVEERRNKAMAENYFSVARSRMNQGRQTSAAAFNYYQTMNNFKNIPPQFMDQKN